MKVLWKRLFGVWQLLGLWSLLGLPLPIAKAGAEAIPTDILNAGSISEKYSAPILLTTLPGSSSLPFSSIAFNQKGDFVFATPEQTVVGERGDAEVEFKKTEIFFFDHTLGHVRKIFEVPDLVNSLILTDENLLLFENFSGVRQTEGIFAFNLLTSQLKDLGGEWMTRLHHRFPRVNYAAHATEQEKIFVEAVDAQDRRILYRQSGEEFRRILWTTFQNGKKDGINVLFTPAFNHYGDVALKVQVGAKDDLGASHPHQKLIVMEGTSNGAVIGARVVAQSNAGEGSKGPEIFHRIANGVAINDDKNCVFIAEKSSSSPSSVYFYHYATGTYESYSTEDLRGDFTPLINNQNRVIFWTRSRDQKRLLNYWNPEAQATLPQSLVQESQSVADLEIIRLMDDIFINDQNRIYFLAQFRQSASSSFGAKCDVQCDVKFGVFMLQPIDPRLVR